MTSTMDLETPEKHHTPKDECSSINTDGCCKTLELTTSSTSSSPLKYDSRTLSPLPPDPPDFPDGGLRAWTVAFGAFCIMFVTFGYVNTWGVFQSYYQEVLLANENPSAISWIGSLQSCLVFVPALVSGRLFDLGWTHIPLLVAEVCLVVSTLVVGECKHLWQFVLVQGLIGGLATGFFFGPALVFISHWFNKRRGLAMAISGGGGSLGGSVLPILVRQLLPRIGFSWTMRVVALLLLVICTTANLCLRRRLPPSYPRGGLFNIQAFKSPVFSTYCISSFFAMLGLYTTLTFLDVSALGYGIDPNFSFYLVAIANASTMWGRIAVGMAGDRFGVTNATIPVSLSVAIYTYCWPLCRTKSALIALAVLYGGSYGAFTTIYVQPVIPLGDMSDAGRRVGMLLSISGVGALVGPPISGAIYARAGGFNEVSYFAGTSMLIATCLVLGTKWAGRGTLSFRDKV